MAERVVGLADKLNAAQSDSWLLQTEMIARSVGTLRLPKNSLLSTGPYNEARLAFIDGESSSTSFAGESFSLRGNSWRPVLESKRVPIPKSRVFRAPETNAMGRFADAVGYPVRILAAREDRYGGSYAVAAGPKELAQVIEALRARHKGSRVAVQAHNDGIRLSMLIAGGEVLSVLDKKMGRDPVEVREQVHPEVLALAVDGIRACPGLNDGSVDIVVDDLSRPLRHQRAWVEAISAKPNLRARVQAHGASASDGPAARYFLHQASQAGVGLEPPAEEVKVQVQFAEVANDVTFASDLEALCHDLSIPFAHIRRISDSVEVQLSGSPASLALVSLQVVLGFSNSQRAHLVRTIPVLG